MICKRRHHRNRRAGTSLLEVMVALAIMAMIAVMVAPLISNSGRALKKSTSLAQIVDIAVAREELHRWLNSAVAQNGEPTESKVATFEGGQHQLTFKAIIDDGYFWPGNAVSISISVVSEDEGTKVIALAQGYSEDRSEIQKQIILSFEDAKLGIKYYGEIDDRSYPSWVDTWLAQTTMPLLVKISISDNQDTYPPIVVKPGYQHSQSDMSLSSLVPPAAPSRP